MPLTSKKQRFADAKLAGASNKDAAIQAGYSPATASPAGARLVKDPDVVAYLGKAKSKVEPRREVETPHDPAGGGAADERDPLKFLEGVMTGAIEANITQVRAAMAMLPFVHQKLGEGGKKEQKQAAAEGVSGGRFGLRSVK